MIRLETVEDFEKVAKVMRNHNAELSEYCVIDYGYCSFCKALRMYYPKQDHIRCSGCDNDFYLDHMGLSYLYMISAGSPDYPEPAQVFDFKLGDDIPKQHRTSKAEIFSGKHQRDLFNFMLNSRILTLKKEQRALSSKIRRLAKLR